MSEEAIFLNSGPLLSGERLEAMEDLSEWQSIDAEARQAYDRIKEAFEKHSTLLAGSPTLDETRFFMINPTLHALGFTHSVFEPVETVDGRVVRLDYVLFPNAEGFDEAQHGRGTMGFFRPAISIVKSVAWSQDVDGLPTAPVAEEGESEEGAEAEAAPAADPSVGQNLPAAELDAFLRATGVDFGIVTNGWNWRLYHRGTSERLDTFFQADLIAAIKSDFEDFKRFYLLFRKGAFLKGNQGTSFLDGQLQ